jgi:hypothetical protein
MDELVVAVAEWYKVLGFYSFATNAQVRISSDPQIVFIEYLEFSVFNWKAFSESVDLRNRQNALHRIQLHWTTKIIG